MKLTHHADGTYSLTGMSREEVSDLGWALSNHVSILQSQRLNGVPDLSPEWLYYAEETARGRELALTEAIGRYGAAPTLPRRKSVDIPERPGYYAAQRIAKAS